MISLLCREAHSLPSSLLNSRLQLLHSFLSSTRKQGRSTEYSTCMMLFKSLFYLSLPVAILGSPTCYYPDGSVAKNYVSCSDGNQISHCCSKESMCLTNGYCMATVGTYSLTRATCTDPSWPSDTCKNPCNYASFTDRSGCTLPLFSNTEEGTYYCASSIVPISSTEVGCFNNTLPFSVPDAKIIADKAVLKNASCVPHILNPTMTAAATNAAATGPTATVTSIPDSNSNSDSNSSGNKDAAIGAGVGVPLGVIALAAVGWALAERRKRYALINSPQPMMMPIPQAEGQMQKPSGYGVQELDAYQSPQELPGKRV